MSKNVSELNDNNFYEEVKKNKVLVVDFWASWCGPCQMMAPVVEELSKEFLGKAKIAKLDVDDNPKIATDFGVMNIPTLIIFKDAQEADRIVGVTSKKDLSHKIKELTD